MKGINLNEVFYSLCLEDIQSVSEQEIERELRIDEIESIKDIIASKINWYDAIAEAISEKIKI